MNDRERAELEYYRQVFANNGGPAPVDPSSFGPAPAAQDALSAEELAAFWPEDLDYDPKYQIAERYRRVYSGWKKAGE